MSVSQDLQRKAKELHDEIIKKWGKTTEQFAQWVKNNNKETGFSTATISGIYKGYNKSARKVQEYCRLCEEYIAYIEAIKNGTLQEQNSSLKKSKLSLYLNRNYYLYYFETRKANDENFIGRSVLKIGTSENDVSIYDSIEGENENRTNYKGTIMMHPNNGNHIILRLQTANFSEKDLKIILRVSNEKETKYMIGGYMNIDKEMSIVMGTIIAERTEENNPTPEVIQPKSESYKNLSEHIKKFFHFKEMNFIKIRNKGIFTENDFIEFFKEQSKKRVIKKTTGAGKIFVAYPMSDIDFITINKTINKICDFLEAKFEVEVFYAGRGMETKEDFEQQPTIAWEENIEHLRTSDKLLMIYPEKLPSSCLIELGFMIGENKPCTIFYKKEEILPYLLKGTIPIRKYIYKDDIDLLKEIERIGSKLF